MKMILKTVGGLICALGMAASVQAEEPQTIAKVEGAKQEVVKTENMLDSAQNNFAEQLIATSTQEIVLEDLSARLNSEKGLQPLTKLDI